MSTHTTLTKPAKTRPTKCAKCGGAGGASHWPGWTCFRCGGHGVDPTYKTWNFPSDWTDEQRQAFLDKKDEQNAKARERRWAKKAAEKQAKIDDFYATLDTNTADRLKAVDVLDFEEKHGITVDILDKLHQWGSISEAQINLIFKVQDELISRKEVEENTPDLEEGRREIEGMVKSLKWKTGYRGYGETLKMLVILDDNTKVWGTVPSTIGEVETGDRVHFMAQVERSADDRTFGFFKRPTKATIIEGVSK